MTIKPAVSLNPGDVITLAETEFVVLDIIDGCPFVVALLNQGNSKFGDNNDYSKSFLRNAMNNWLEDFDIDSDLVMEREIDLTTLDGYKGYGKLKVKAAPLTMDVPSAPLGRKPASSCVQAARPSSRARTANIWMFVRFMMRVV